MNAAARILPVLVSSHADRVQCVPYRAELSARACLANQATASSAEASSDQRLSLGRCGGCEIGLRVASDLRGVKDPREATADRCRCGALVRNAKGRIPVCGSCRRKGP